MDNTFSPQFLKYPGMIFKKMMTDKNIFKKLLLIIFVLSYLITRFLSMETQAFNALTSTYSVVNNGGSWSFTSSPKGTGWVRVRMWGSTPTYQASSFNATNARYDGLQMEFGMISPYYSNYYDLYFSKQAGDRTDSPRDTTSSIERNHSGGHSNSSGSSYTYLKGGQVTFTKRSGNTGSFSTSTTWEHEGSSGDSAIQRKEYLNNLSGQYEVVSATLTETASYRYKGEDTPAGYDYDLTIDVKINNSGKNAVGLTPTFYVMAYAKDNDYNNDDWFDDRLWESSYTPSDAEMMSETTVSWNGNGGSNGTDIKKAPGTTQTAPTSSRTGYTSKGWYTAASGGTRIATNGGTYTQPTANTTYYAQWTPNNYTISYNGNGGSSTSQTKAYDSTLGTLPTPTRVGYNFNGWYTAKTGGSKVTTGTKVAGDATYYAQWTARTDTKYKVEHYQMNLDGKNYTLKDTDNLTGTSDATIKPAVKTYTGFTSPSVQTSTISADGSRVVKYYYTRNKYNFTLGSATGVSTSGSTATGSYYYGSTITLKATPLNGYEWIKWSDGNTNQNVTFTMPAEAVSRTPSAKTITYTITYKLNGGKVDYMKKYYNVETPTFYIDNPTKKGFTFTGWTGTGISGASTDLSVPLGSYGNKTFTATWGDGVYTINFDGNGETSGSMSSLTVKSGESITLPENAFVKDGYSFVGWYTTKHDAFGTFYKNKATITNLTESLTLRAQWKLNRGNNPTDDGPGNDDGNGNNPGGNSGDNGGNGNGGNGGNNGNGDDDDHNITPKDELGYFGTASRRNEISIRTTLGMQDKKLTLNYNF